MSRGIVCWNKLEQIKYEFLSNICLYNLRQVWWSSTLTKSKMRKAKLIPFCGYNFQIKQSLNRDEHVWLWRSDTYGSPANSTWICDGNFKNDISSWGAGLKKRKKCADFELIYQHQPLVCSRQRVLAWRELLLIVYVSQEVTNFNKRWIEDFPYVLSSTITSIQEMN